jgi:EmrB/QacA subfamily drug resistance transporter
MICSAIPSPPPRPLTGHAVPLAVASGLLMEFIDSTALSTALPTLARAFATDPLHLKLALTAYLAALAVFVPASGWAADRFGARRVFLTAMAIFLLGSALCAFSRSLGELVAARLVQGLGGALMTPVGRLIIVETSSKQRLVTAMAWFTTPALLGPLLGPPLAGLILELGDWPWIFLVNIPVGMLGMLAVRRLVPPLERPNPGRFDWVGFGLLAAGIVAIVVLAETAGTSILPVAARPVALVTVAVALTLYVRHAHRAPRPVIPLRLLAYQTFRTSLIGGTLMRLGLGATPFLMPLLLQTGLGWSPGEAGLITMATGVGALAARSLVASAIRRLGFKTMLVGSGLLAALLTAIPGFFSSNTPLWLMLPVLIATGMARAAQFTSTNTIAFADVPDSDLSAASTFSQVVQQLGMSLGVTAGALALGLARTGDFRLPFLMVGGVSLLAAPVYFRLPANAGARIRGAALRHNQQLHT